MVLLDHAAVSQDAAVRVRGLSVVYRTDVGERAAVRSVDLDLSPGQITGIVGESGSGKSTLALALLNAVPKPGRIAAGSIEVGDLGEITGLTGRRLRRLRGGEIGYVFQASQNSLNPLKTIGKQLLDLGRSHGVDDLRGMLRDARELAGRMGLDGARVLDSYQHELSGGMRQRVGIMFALVLNARVLVLDEPTTALDMLSQVAVLDIVREIHRERGLATVIITHDMGVVAELADRIAVMYGGRLVEVGPAVEVLRDPRHPYTRALIRAIPRLVGDPEAARALPGRPPDLVTLPQEGCVFRERCPLALPVCATHDPAMTHDGGRGVACHAADGTLNPTEGQARNEPIQAGGEKLS